VELDAAISLQDGLRGPGKHMRGPSYVGLVPLSPVGFPPVSAVLLMLTEIFIQQEIEESVTDIPLNVLPMHLKIDVRF